jgi:hypothetical protein
MSLVGSLEDLGLGEILQIISLSRKSGTLRLRSTEGEGHIVFSDGEIRAASLKGEPTDLADLLVRRGVLSGEEVDRLLAHARARGEVFEDLLLRHRVVGIERLDALRLEHVEGAVLTMFGWVTGEFSFEMHAAGVAPHPGGLTLSSGINPQFLALEGTRLLDEAALGAEGPATDDGGLPFVEEGPEAAPAQDAPPVLPRVAVVIEPELPCLEAVKRALGESVTRVHAFQRSDLGIERIRQYLGRGETPLVLLSHVAPADRLSGARDWRQLVARLKAQAPRMPIWLLAPAGESSVGEPSVDAVLPRPEAGEVAAFEAVLAARLGGPAAAPAEPPAQAPALAGPEPFRLRDTLRRLRDPEAPVEVIPQVLRFAAERLSRVALFMVRDEVALGLAQLGLGRAGGPDDAGLRAVELPAREPAWFRRVLDAGEGRCAPPEDAGDQRLAFLLGNALPAEAYVGPIRSGGRAVALLYGDPLPGSGRLGDLADLEAVLREAGLAFDRLLRARSA